MRHLLSDIKTKIKNFRIEHYWKDVVSKKKKGFFPLFLRGLLYPLSWFFAFFVFLRKLAFSWGFYRRYDPPVPLVISVGNLTVGGTGKTPFTLLLASHLNEKKTIALLYRGYKAKAEKLSTPLTLCRGKGPMFPAHYSGDEPYLLALKLPHTHIFVGKDRVTSARLASESGADVILMDDGLQHQRLVRTFDIVLLDIDDPFGQGYYLPRGFLREGLASLRLAHLVVLHPVATPQQFEEKRKDISSLTKSPIIGTSLEVIGVKTLEGEDVGSLIGASVGIFCAIAKPERFKKTVETLGAVIVQEKFFADHEKFSAKDLEDFARSTKEKWGTALVCTEKDRVKLPENLSLSLPIFWVDVSMKVTQNREEWEKFLGGIKKKYDV